MEGINAIAIAPVLIVIVQNQMTIHGLRLAEGVIQGTAFSGENVLEMKTSNLNGLVNAEKMILKDGNSQYTIHKV